METRYPNFVALLRQAAASDTKRLWQRWLNTQPELSDDVFDGLMGKVHPRYLTCALLMMFSPDHDLVRQVTGWRYKGVAELGGYFSFLPIEDIEPDDANATQYLRAAEKVVLAVLHDLAALSVTELTETEIQLWHRYEDVIRCSMWYRTADDPVAQELFKHLRFFMKGPLEYYKDSARPISELTCGEDVFADHRWIMLMHMNMQQQIRQELVGALVQPVGYVPLAEQYAEHVCSDAWSGVPPHDDFLPAVEFAARLGLFGMYRAPLDVTQVASFVEDSETLYYLALNLPKCPRNDYLLSGEHALQQLERMIDAVRQYGDDEQYAQILALRPEVIRRTEEDRVKDEAESEEERAQQQKDRASVQSMEDLLALMKD